MPIYLDHASTTPLRPEALEAMLPFLGPTFGNPSSGHAWGRAARTALDEARERLAAALGGTAREVVLTSGGTEANNLGLKGAAWVGRARGSRIVTSPIEHHAVGHSLAHLATFGFEVIEVGVDRTGRVDPDEVAAAVDERTIVLALMLANNEVGSVQPVREVIERLPRRRGVHVHVDAVAAAPYLDLDVAALGADTVALGAHKFEGPKGVGALWIRRGTPLLVQAHGGGQERHRRAGTENVAGAVGMAVAYELACAAKPATRARLEDFRSRLAAACGVIDGVEICGHPSERLPGLLSLLCHGASGTAMTVALDLAGIAASAGSACATGDAGPSHVLLAMGYAPDEAASALRLSLGRTTTAAEIDEAALAIPRIIAATRAGMASPGGASIASGQPG